MSENDPELQSQQQANLLSQNAMQNAERLTELYTREKAAAKFTRTLEESLGKERQQIEQLKEAYIPHLGASKIRFLKGEYFEENERFHPFQQIPEKYLTYDCEEYYFISHRWLSLQDPDPQGEQFALIKAKYAQLKSEIQHSWGYWYDYACIPQRDGNGERTPEEEKLFQAALKVMHLLPSLSSNLVLFDSNYLGRAWCMMEWMCATKISPLPTEDQPFAPLFNLVKFRHMALLVLFLIKDLDFKTRFMRGDDVLAITHLNSLTRKTINDCISAIENDKPLLVSLLYQHYWQNLRFVGLRTELMIAFLILDRLDETVIELLFAQFLILSGDPDMNWTKETTFIMESLVNGLGAPTDMVFHDLDIDVNSNSKHE